MNDSDSFFSGKPTSDESRPKAVNPRTGKEQSWQRASNYAAPLDNPHGLITWKLRELVKGISARPDIARMLLTGALIEDNAKADEIIAAAHAVAGIDAKANNGTAVHAALSRSFLGHETPPEYLPHVNAFVAELRRNGLEPVATELVLLNDHLGGLGHADWVVKTADGRYLVLDVKTGKLGDARKFAVQCMVYAGSEYIDDGKGRNTFVRIPWVIDRSEAILAHVDPETGATALYRVDLMLGAYGAALAERVRGWAKIEVLSPYTPVHPAVPALGTLQPECVENRGTVDQAALVSSTQHTQVVGPIEVTEPRPASAETALQAAEQHAVSPVAPSMEPAAIEAERAELMQARNDKSALQIMAKNLGLSDLAHNRQWLADWIIATRRGAGSATATAFAKSKGQMLLNGVKTYEGPSTEPDRQSGDLSFIFKSIEGAKSEGAILALQQNVIERRGDQAWTDEMAEAARLRVLQLIGAENNAVDPALRVIARIQQATEQQHIASIWAEVTLNASAPENWTPEMQSAAEAQMARIQQAQPAPPANPFGAPQG